MNDTEHEHERHYPERDHDQRIEELLEAILHRLSEPIEVDVTIHVVNKAGPAVKVVLEPQTPTTEPSKGIEP